MRNLFVLISIVALMAIAVLLFGCADSKFVGTYSLPSGATIILRADGSGTAGGGFFHPSSDFKWTEVDDNTVHISEWDIAISVSPVLCSGTLSFSPDGLFMDADWENGKGQGGNQGGFRKEQ